MGRKRKQRRTAGDGASKGTVGVARPAQSKRWGRLAGALIVVAVAVVGFWGWSVLRSTGSTSPVQPVVGSAPDFNVLLITLDTVRADRLGCYGYGAAETPTLDGLADSGVLFERAYCHVPLTLPSHTSILTGTYPVTSGVRVNGATALSDEVQTLAEVFQAGGVRTGAFVSATVLDIVFGLGRGFDTYDDDYEPEESGDSVHAERRADKVCDAALAWLDEAPSDPFFAWVHFYDPHVPYDPPEPYRGRADHPYDGEIAFVDSQVRRLLDWLDARQLRDRTLVVVVGDHGESFDEHGEPQHGLFIYNTTMHVPLIISQPSTLPAARVKTDVRLIDIFSTVVELVGWPVPQGVEGVSLAPACRGGGIASLPVYGESKYAQLGYGWSPLASLADQEWKYIEAPQPELYHRIDDPGEVNNVFLEQRPVASRMQAQLSEMIEQMVPRAGRSVEMDAATRRRLESLGYVGGGGGSSGGGDSGSARDPKDMVAVFRAHMVANRSLMLHKYAEVVAMMEPLVARSPESDELYSTLGRAYLEVGRPEDAEMAFAASLRQVPTNQDRMCGLGEALERQGRTAEAIQIYEQVVSIDPDYAQAHGRLGTIFANQRRFPEAYEHFRRFSELNPTSAVALNNMGNALVPLGRTTEAVELIRRALEMDPAGNAHRSLWRALRAARRPGEAIEALRAARKVFPGDKALTLSLARMLATTSRRELRNPREALQLAGKVCNESPPTAEALDVLAMAYAASGDFSRAIEAAQRAISAAYQTGDGARAQKIQRRLQLYESGQSVQP